MSSGHVVKVTVEQDEITAEVARAFDVPFDGISQTEIPPPPDVPEDWGIGVIVGPSGAGKSTLMREFGEEEVVKWDADRAIASHFDSHEEATDRLSATGLNTISSWLRPYRVLSTGEKFRADLARRVKAGAVIDEYTSVVDRNVAKAASCALAKYVQRKEIRRLLLVGCHYDVLEWLQPDWVYDLGQSPPKMVTGRYLQRPEIRLRIYHCERHVWSIFAKHHYLTGEIAGSTRCFLATWSNGETESVVGFVGVLSFPHPIIKRAWRLHRLVILPDYQGLGIGPAIMEAVGNEYLNTGQRFYLRTAHVRLTDYCRAHAAFYRELPKGSGARGETSSLEGDWTRDGRPSVGFEYLGAGQTLEWEKRQPTPLRARPGIEVDDDRDRKAQAFVQNLAEKPPEEITYDDMVQLLLCELSDYDAKSSVRVQWARELRENIRLARQERRQDEASHVVFHVIHGDSLPPLEDAPELPKLPEPKDP